MNDQGYLFDMPEPTDVALDEALRTSFDAENKFRTITIERLRRIEALIERVLKQVENRM